MDKSGKAELKPVRQRTQYTCVATSVMMALNALGKNLTEDQVNRILGAEPKKGARWEEAIATIQYFGCRATLTAPSTLKQIKQWTDQGKPVLIAWNPEGRPWSHASCVFHVEQGPPARWAEDVGDDAQIQGSDEGLYVWVADPNIPNPSKTYRIVHEREFYERWGEDWGDFIVRRPALLVDLEITQDGRQVMASDKSAGRRRKRMKQVNAPKDPKEQYRVRGKAPKQRNEIAEALAANRGQGNPGAHHTRTRDVATGRSRKPKHRNRDWGKEAETSVANTELQSSFYKRLDGEALQVTPLRTMPDYGEIDMLDLNEMLEMLEREENLSLNASQMKKALKTASRRPAGGLYGYTKQTQRDVLNSVKRVQKAAAKIARTVYAKDKDTFNFLHLHADRSNSLSARILCAAMENIGPKVASTKTADHLNAPTNDTEKALRKAGDQLIKMAQSADKGVKVVNTSEWFGGFGGTTRPKLDFRLAVGEWPGGPVGFAGKEGNWVDIYIVADQGETGKPVFICDPYGKKVKTGSIGKAMACVESVLYPHGRPQELSVCAAEYLKAWVREYGKPDFLDKSGKRWYWGVSKETAKERGMDTSVQNSPNMPDFFDKWRYQQGEMAYRNRADSRIQVKNTSRTVEIRMLKNGISKMASAQTSTKTAVSGYGAAYKFSDEDQRHLYEQLRMIAENDGSTYGNAQRAVSKAFATYKKSKDEDLRYDYKQVAKVLIQDLEEEWGKTASTKTAANRGMYGYKIRTAKLALQACIDISQEAGSVAYDLHTRRTAKHERITSFLKDHSKRGRCRYARLLLRFYPEMTANLVTASDEDEAEDEKEAKHEKGKKVPLSKMPKELQENAKDESKHLKSAARIDEIGRGKNPYIFMWDGNRLHIHANTYHEAHDMGMAYYQERSSKPVNTWETSLFEAQKGGAKGFKRKQTYATVKSARLMKRQEKVLEKFLAKGGSATFFDDLPRDVQSALRRIKDQETLHMDVDRWLGDHNMPDSLMRSMWAIERAKELIKEAGGCENLPNEAMQEACEAKKKDGDKEGEDDSKTAGCENLPNEAMQQACEDKKKDGDDKEAEDDGKKASFRTRLTTRIANGEIQKNEVRYAADEDEEKEEDWKEGDSMGRSQLPGEEESNQAQPKLEGNSGYNPGGTEFNGYQSKTSADAEELAAKAEGRTYLPGDEESDKVQPDMNEHGFDAGSAVKVGNEVVTVTSVTPLPDGSALYWVE